MKNYLKKISMVALATILGSTLSLLNADSYIELQTGKVNFDDIAVSNGTIYGLGFRSLSLSDSSPLIYGLELGLGANKDIGMMEIGANAGANLKLTPTSNIKLYGILGYGAQVTDDFQGNGLYYGVGSTYDISSHFAIALQYKIHSTTFESSYEDSDLEFDADVNTLLLNLAFRF